MTNATKQVLTLLMNIKSSRPVLIDEKESVEDAGKVSLHFEPSETKAGRAMYGFDYIINKSDSENIWWGEVNSNMGYSVKEEKK